MITRFTRSEDRIGFIGLFSVFFSLTSFFIVPVDAYYSQVAKNTNFVHERSQVDWGEGERLFVFYDNFSYSLAEDIQLPLLTPVTREFVPSDYVVANLPLTDLFRPSLIVKDQVANMLYANLRLVKLIEEFSEAQEKAYQLMNDIEEMKSYYAVALNSQTGVQHPAGKAAVASVGEKTKGAVSPGDPIKKWTGKNRREKIAVRNVKRGDLPASYTGGKVQDGTSPVPSTLADMYHSIRETSDRRATGKSEHGTQQIETGKIDLPATIASPYSTSRSNRGASSRESYREEPRSRDTDTYYDRDIKVPWIIRIPLKVFQYIIGNKLESFAYLLIILVPILLITSAKSR